MKTNKQLITLLIFLLLGFACTTYMDELDSDKLSKSEIQPDSDQAIPDVKNDIIEKDYDAGVMNFMDKGLIDLGGKYYYSALGNNKPVIVIAHADGTNGVEAYDGLANHLATLGYFVALPRRASGEFEHTVDAFPLLLQKNLIALYSQFNGITYSTNNLPIIDEPGKPSLLADEIMLVGHSAGGRDVFYRGKDAVNELVGLSLKSIVGIAPTLGTVYGLGPNLFNTPFFIIQGDADSDNNNVLPTVHYKLEPIASKVGLFESSIHQNGNERAYILTNGVHSIQNENVVKKLIQAIADKYLKESELNFDLLIKQQGLSEFSKLPNVLYWNNSDDIYYTADNVEILQPDQKLAIITTEGLALEEKFSQELLGSTEATKTLHWTNVLKIEKDKAFYQEKYPPRTLKFMFNENISIAKSYLRFNAGELYDFEIETYSDDSIDPAIRLIFSGNKEGIPSNWVQMSDLNCGKIISATFGYINRNIMQTYVIPLDSFTKAPAGSSIIGVEFDFTYAIGEKTVLLDDLGFMD